MSSAFSGSRQQMYSPYSQIGVDPFGYSPGGTFMGGLGGFGVPSYGMGYGGFGGFGGYGGGMPSMYGGMSGYNNPFVPGFAGGGGFSNYGGSPFGGGLNRVQSMLAGGGYPTSFGGMGMGGGSMGYQFPVPPQPSVNDLFGQYMMNQYYGGGAFNPYQLPSSDYTLYGGGRSVLGGGGFFRRPAQPRGALEFDPNQTPDAPVPAPPTLPDAPFLDSLLPQRLAPFPVVSPSGLPTPAAIQQQLNAPLPAPAPFPAPLPAPPPAPIPPPTRAATPAPALDVSARANEIFNDFVRSNPNADPTMLRNLANERAMRLAQL